MSFKESESAEGLDYFTIVTTEATTLHVMPPLIYDKDTGDEYYLSISYSINGVEWQEYSGDELSIALLENSRVRFQAEYPRQGIYDTLFAFDCDAPYGVGGSIMSLFYGSRFVGNNAMPDCFPYGSVTFHIDESQSFNNPDSNLSFIEDPKIFLPATALSHSCYDSMFSRCINLVEGPELPAQKLVDKCYMYMFDGCKKLNSIKMLATDISAPDSLYCWTRDVAKTGTFVKNAAATWDVTGINGVPEGWTIQTE